MEGIYCSLYCTLYPLNLRKEKVYSRLGLKCGELLFKITTSVKCTYFIQRPLKYCQHADVFIRASTLTNDKKMTDSNDRIETKNQQTFLCSNSTIETLEKSVKYPQS